MMDTHEKLRFEQTLELERDKDRLDQAKEDIRKEKLTQIKKRNEAKV